MTDERKPYQSRVWLLLYAIMPVFTMTQRFGLESHHMLWISIAILYFSLRALEKETLRDYFLLGLAIGISLHGYVLSYIVSAVYFLCLTGYLLILKKWNWKRFLAMAIPLGILALPLVLVQAINLFHLPTLRIGPFTFVQLNRYRLNELTVNARTMLENLGRILKCTLFSDDLTYNTAKKFGCLYYISLPFTAVGFVRAVRDGEGALRPKTEAQGGEGALRPKTEAQGGEGVLRSQTEAQGGEGVLRSQTEARDGEREGLRSALVLLWTLSELIMGLFLAGNSLPNSTRMIGLFAPLLYFTVLGLRQVYLWLKQDFRTLYVTACVAMYAACFVYFAVFYFTAFNQEAFPMNWLFYEPYDEVREFLAENDGEEWTDLPVCYPWNYVYYLLTYQVDPYEADLPANGFLSYRGDAINEYTCAEDLRYHYVTLKPPGNPSTDISLAAKGYQRYDLGDRFYFLMSPLAAYAEEENTEEVSVCLDRIARQGDLIELSGWCVEKASDGVFAGLRLEAEPAGRCDVERTEREDVAAVFGKDGYHDCGFEGKIPWDVWENAEVLRLIGTTEDGRETEILTWEKRAVSVKGADLREVTETN